MNCEVDIHFNVTVSSDSFVSVNPNIADKNADNKLIQSKSNKTKKKCKRRHSDPGLKRTRYDSI